MARKRVKEINLTRDNINKVYGRKPSAIDKVLFQHKPRLPSCLYTKGRFHLKVNKIDHNQISNILAFQCNTIEHQMITLRAITQLSMEDYEARYSFTKLLLTCLHKHHDIVYQGILFGSTVNGLGFRDSDVDLRLRPLSKIRKKVYEPIVINEDMVEKTLRNISFQTTKCSPVIGEFVPSTRCPVAKMTFLKSTNIDDMPPINLDKLEEGLKYDISLSSSNPLATFNSMFLRFLCYLEPKFHLLATTLRYWSNVHELIVPGYLSSYALINMLIFFCQTVQPPLLPSLNFMRDLYFLQPEQSNGAGPQQAATNGTDHDSSSSNCKRGLTQLEWHCILCLRKELYPPSANNEPLSVLLLKFFETYLNFPYSNHIITIRAGRSLTHEEFKTSTQFHPCFPVGTFLNIQDPFDLKHNLTSGMQAGHFQKIMMTIRYSYERLFKELLNRFTRPQFSPQMQTELMNRKRKQKGAVKTDPRDWGLNALFVRLTDQEFKDFE